MKEHIVQKLLTIVQAILKNKGIDSDDEIDLNSPLQEHGIGLGSIEILTLMSEIENQFKVEIPEKFWGNQNFQTLNDIVNFLHDQN